MQLLSQSAEEKETKISITRICLLNVSGKVHGIILIESVQEIKNKISENK